MANPLLAAGAGAGQGLEDVLNRMLLEERLKQEGAAQQETVRHNQADEAFRNRSLDVTDAERTSRDASLNADRQERIGAKNREDAMKNLDTTPIGTILSPDTRNTLMKGVGGVPEQFGDYQPPSMGMSTPTGEVGPSAEGFKWPGTQDQITKAAVAGKHPGDKGVVRDTDKGLIRLFADGTTEPVTDDTGSVLKGYHAPVQPVVVQGATGPNVLNRGTGVATPVKDGSGNPLGPAPSAQERNRGDMSTRILSHFDTIQQELDDAEKAGALGPIKGRTVNDFLAGKVGSTGDDTKDELLGQLNMDLGAATSGFASLHGRGGANAGLARDISTKMAASHMSHAELTGALKAMRNWVSSYAAKPTTGTAAADPNDPLGLFKK